MEGQDCVAERCITIMNPSDYVHIAVRRTAEREKRRKLWWPYLASAIHNLPTWKRKQNKQQQQPKTMSGQTALNLH